MAYENYFVNICLGIEYISLIISIIAIFIVGLATAKRIRAITFLVTSFFLVCLYVFVIPDTSSGRINVIKWIIVIVLALMWIQVFYEYARSPKGVFLSNMWDIRTIVYYSFYLISVIYLTFISFYSEEQPQLSGNIRKVVLSHFEGSKIGLPDSIEVPNVYKTDTCAQVDTKCRQALADTLSPAAIIAWQKSLDSYYKLLNKPKTDVNKSYKIIYTPRGVLGRQTEIGSTNQPISVYPDNRGPKDNTWLELLTVGAIDISQEHESDLNKTITVNIVPYYDDDTGVYNPIELNQVQLKTSARELVGLVREVIRLEWSLGWLKTRKLKNLKFTVERGGWTRPLRATDNITVADIDTFIHAETGRLEINVEVWNLPGHPPITKSEPALESPQPLIN